jgi:hypothetical protein
MTPRKRVSLRSLDRWPKDTDMLGCGQGRSASPRRSPIRSRSPRVHSWIERGTAGVAMEPASVRGTARSHWLVPVNNVFSPKTPSPTERLTANAVLQRNTPLLVVSPSTPMLDWTSSSPTQSSSVTIPSARIAPPSENVTDVLASVGGCPREADGRAAFTPSMNGGIGGQASDKAAQQLTCNPLNLFVPSAGDGLHDGPVNVPLISYDILPIVSDPGIDHAQNQIDSDSDGVEELVATVHLARNLLLSPCKATLSVLPPPISPTRSTFSLSDIGTEGTAVSGSPASVNNLNGSNSVYAKKPFARTAAERPSSEQTATEPPRRLIKKRVPTVLPRHEVRPSCSSLSTSISEHTYAPTKREKDGSSGFATRRFVKHIPRFSKRKEESNGMDIIGSEQTASPRRSKNAPRQSKMVHRESLDDDFEWPFKQQRGRIGNQDVVIVQRRTYVEVEEISRIRPTRLKMRRSLESF